MAADPDPSDLTRRLSGTRTGRRSGDRVLEEPTRRNPHGHVDASGCSAIVARLQAAARAVTPYTVRTVPTVIVSAFTDHAPACDAAAMLFPDGVTKTGERFLPDAATGPVMIGVLAADAMTRGGPLHGTLRRRSDRRERLPFCTGDLRTEPRWQKFNDRLIRTGSPVRSMLILPVDGVVPAVLVLASFKATAGLSIDSMPVEALTDAVRGLVHAATETSTDARSNRSLR